MKTVFFSTISPPSAEKNRRNEVNKNNVLVLLTIVILAVVLVAPATAQEPTIYVVQPGDTLYSIARSLGVTISQIALANGITNPNRIFVGQRLVIPTASRQSQSSPRPVVQSKQITCPNPIPSRRWRGPAIPKAGDILNHGEMRMFPKMDFCWSQSAMGWVPKGTWDREIGHSGNLFCEQCTDGGYWTPQGQKPPQPLPEGNPSDPLYRGRITSNATATCGASSGCWTVEVACQYDEYYDMFQWFNPNVNSLTCSEVRRVTFYRQDAQVSVTYYERLFGYGNHVKVVKEGSGALWS